MTINKKVPAFPVSGDKLIRYGERIRKANILYQSQTKSHTLTNKKNATTLAIVAFLLAETERLELPAVSSPVD